MTEPQRKIFSKLLDVNYEHSQETNPVKKYELANQVSILTGELKKAMGEEAYNTFMTNGRKMFAPA